MPSLAGGIQDLLMQLKGKRETEEGGREMGGNIFHCNCGEMEDIHFNIVLGLFFFSLFLLYSSFVPPSHSLLSSPQSLPNSLRVGLSSQSLNSNSNHLLSSVPVDYVQCLINPHLSSLT